MDAPMILTYDYETTGADPKKDRPVQIGLTAGVATTRICLNMLVDPCMAIAEGETNVHGIAAEHVQGHPDYLIGVYVMASLIQRLSGDVDIILAGFNHEKFDNVITDRCLGQEFTSQYKQLDVLRALRRYYPKLPSHKLGEAYQHLIGKELVGAHGAVQDCLGSMELLAFMETDLKKTPTQLAEELAVPKVFDIMPIGKFKGHPPNQIDPGWAGWMRTNAKDMDPDLKATVDYLLQGCPGAV